MKRIYQVALLVLVLLTSFSTLQAKVVSQSEALQVATDFFRTNNATTLALGQLSEVWNSSQLAQNGVTTLSATETPTFYVFAPEEGKGFVVVSGDDLTLPILGYSFDKTLTIGDDMPCNFRWWCEAMDRQVSLLRASGIESAKKTHDNGISTFAADELLIETAEWNQLEPYNLQCPMDGSSRSATGCVSTAFAIAMRYHSHPTTGTGTTAAYTTSTKGIYVDSRDLSSHAYDWDNMLMTYDSGYTDAQAQAVATLIADIGAALQADYASESTSTNVGLTTPVQFYEHFGYSSSCYLALADAYSDDDWTALMKQEINTNGPVSYTSVGLVHQFVLDGYQSNSYFHINWGWGGYDNGYFLLPDVVEGQDTQYAFMNFVPDDGKQLTTLQVCDYDGVMGLNTTNEIFTTGESFTMGLAYFLNVGAADFNGTVAYGLTDSEGNLKEVISSSASISNLPPSYLSGLNSAKCTITSTIEAGDCIRYIYKDTNASDWRCMEPYENVVVYKIVITEDMIGQPEEHQYTLQMYTPGLSVNTDVFYTGITFNATFSVCNLSGETVTTYLCIGLTDSDGNLKEWLSNNITASLQNGQVTNASSFPCSIKGDIEAGDRIRLFYQGIQGRDDTWKAIDSYYGLACPLEVVITEDMITEPEEHQYTLLMYTPGLSVSTNEFYEPGCTFTADAYPINVSGETITTYLRFALTDSNGNVKEWLSSNMLLNGMGSGYYSSIKDISCTITNGVEAGDFIRLFYQGVYNDEGTWKAIDSYYGSACPVEVEITEDMIIPTGISSVSIDHEADDGNIYTIQGIRVNDMTQPGIYIKNGRKILVK